MQINGLQLSRGGLVNLNFFPLKSEGVKSELIKRQLNLPKKPLCKKSNISISRIKSLKKILKAFTESFHRKTASFGLPDRRKSV